MLKAAREAVVDMIIDLVNQIAVERLIPVEWELSTIVNCYKGKRDGLERGNDRWLKLTNQILKIVVGVIEKLGR